MTMTQKEQQEAYLAALFENDEIVCFGNRVEDTLASRVSLARPTNYITLNPLLPETTRKDASVAALRNILVELDAGAIEEQKQFIADLKMPFTTCTYSGGKSLHYVISLVDPAPTKEAYDRLVRLVYHVLDPKNKGKIDRSTRNPSRFTRQAGVYRGDVLQELVEVRGRISQKELIYWASNNVGARKCAEIIHNWQAESKLRVAAPSMNGDKAELTLRSKNFIETQKPITDWRSEAMFLLCDAYRSGYSIDEARELLISVDGYLEADSERLVEDAYNKVLTSGQLNSRLEAALATSKEQDDA